MPAPHAQSTTAPRGPVPIRPGLPMSAFVGLGVVSGAFVHFRRAVTSAELEPAEREQLARFLEAFAREVRRG